MELDSLPQPALEQLERVHGADLMVGILRPGGNGNQAAAAAMVREALQGFPQAPRAVLVVDDSAGATHVGEEQSLPILFYNLCDSSSAAASPQGILSAYQSILQLGGKIGVRACTVIASELQAVTPMWIDRLVRPLLEMDFDMVAPRYALHKWEGLISRSILSPLNLSLYGKLLQSHMGPDFGLSGRLMKSILEDQAGTRGATPGNQAVSVVSTAVRANLQVCEAQVGSRLQPPADWMNLSSLIAQVLRPAFLDIDRNAAVWQRVRESQGVPAFGALEPAPGESGPVDTGRLIDSFQLGVKNLQDIWSLVLPPTVLLEIRKLARTPAGQFRMSDEVWVSIVYDFALAHRVRTINREHLLRSFTPLYLGWIASYALEMERGGSFEVEARLERLARAYEAGKPYLVSRWRWPDRFNP